MGKNLYEILGVKEGATEEELDSAYKHIRKSLQEKYEHGDPEAKLMLFNLDGAYSILSNPEKRSKYDKSNKSPSIAAQPPSTKDNHKGDATVGNNKGPADNRHEKDHKRSTKEHVVLGEFGDIKVMTAGLLGLAVGYINHHDRLSLAINDLAGMAEAAVCCPCMAIPVVMVIAIIAIGFVSYLLGGVLVGGVINQLVRSNKALYYVTCVAIVLVAGYFGFRTVDIDRRSVSVSECKHDLIILGRLRSKSADSYYLGDLGLKRTAITDEESKSVGQCGKQALTLLETYFYLRDDLSNIRHTMSQAMSGSDIDLATEREKKSVDDAKRAYDEEIRKIRTAID